MTQDRPTWRLQDQILPATFPAAGVDRIAAIETALSRQAPYERCNEVTEFVKSALTYHVEAAAEAYVALAAKSTAGSISGFAGWEAKTIDTALPGAADLLLTNPDHPGGYHVSIRARPVLTEDAEANLRVFQSKAEKELDALGIPASERLMRDVLGTNHPTTNEVFIESLKKHPDSYRGVAAGDVFDKLIVTAVNISGPPPGVEAQDCNAQSEVLGKDVDDGYFRGQHIHIGRSHVPDEDGMLSESTALRIGGSAEIITPILSGLLKENGLGAAIAARNAEIGKLSWKCFGDAAGAERSEAAHACVSESEGLFDAGVLEDVQAFARGVACHDISRHADDYVSLARNLLAGGHVDTESAFDANDLRDWVHVEQKDEVLSLFNRTENGAYRLDIGLDGDGEAAVLEAFTISAPGKPCIGRFHRDEGIWREDYAGDVIWGDQVEQNIRNLRDLNNMISSLASLACVLEEELKERAPEETPEP